MCSIDRRRENVERRTMPLYEYQCDGTCRQRFEVIQKFSDPPVEKCPNCGGPVHKLMSAPGFQFKGSGWYITDYARKDHSPSGKAAWRERVEISVGGVS